MSTLKQTKNNWTKVHRLGQAGFTLIETLVAMVIMTGGIIIMANAWSGNVMRIQGARVNNTIASLLERKMTEVEIEYKEKPAEVPDEDNGDFGPKFPGYRWELESQPFEMPDMSGSLAAREGGVDETTLTVVRTVSDYIKQAVKEVNVSVYYKTRKGRETKHGVTMYMVDYTKEINIPGVGSTGMPPGEPPK